MAVVEEPLGVAERPERVGQVVVGQVAPEHQIMERLTQVVAVVALDMTGQLETAATAAPA